MFRRRVHLGRSARELWRARPLIRTLAERELRVRYKQAVFGFAWAIITPVALMVVLTTFFKRVANIDTEGVPYPLFAYLGLLPWTFFTSSVATGGTSLLTNQAVLNKVYCPREVFPFASLAVAGIDTVSAASALGVLFVVTGFAPKATSVWVPLIFLTQLAFTMGVTLIVSSSIVYLRDIRHALSIVLQLGLFATPVAYGIEEIPASFRPLYALLNPLAPVIDGYRRTVLLGRRPQLDLLGLGAITASIVLVGGYLLFKRLETGFADVA